MIKPLILISFITIFSISVVAQSENAERIIFLNTNEHIINNGVVTYDFKINKTLMVDSLNNVLREISYKTKGERKIDYYKVFLYKDNKLFVEEKYNENDSLVKKQTFYYDKKGLISKKSIFREDHTEQIVTEFYKMSPNGKPLKITGRNEDGKKIYTAKFSYDKNNYKTKENWKSRISFPDDKIKKYRGETITDSLGRIKEVKADHKYFNNNTETIHFIKEYPSQDIVWKNYLDNSGNILKKVKTTYDQYGNKKSMSVYDGNDNIIKHINYKPIEKYVIFEENEHYVN